MISQQEKPIFDYLSRARVHSSLLISGNSRTGRKNTAVKMAQYLFCPNRSQEACYRCSSCRRIFEGHHPDLLWLVEEEEATLKIERVRELISEMEVAPIEGGVKIAVIEESHRFNLASQNAFLKSLEEPGSNRYFFLLTDKPNRFLPTILSRCVQLSLGPTVEEADNEALKEAKEWVTEYLQTRDTQALLKKVSDKKEYLHVLQLFQKYFRDKVVSAPVSDDVYDWLQKFDETLILEDKWHSNANYQLQLEVFLKKYVQA